MYTVKFSKKAKKQLKKMDKHLGALIIGWIEKNLTDCSDPRRHGKSLSGNHLGVWRYRVGDYRILANIQDEDVIILVINLGHRKEIY